MLLSLKPLCCYLSIKTKSVYTKDLNKPARVSQSNTDSRSPDKIVPLKLAKGFTILA